MPGKLGTHTSFHVDAGFCAVSEVGKARTVSEASAALFCYCGAVAEAFAVSRLADKNQSRRLGLRVFHLPVDPQVQ